jgi:hypothetical protein
MYRIVANIIFLVALLPWAFIFMFSFMLFDTPGSESSALTRGLFYSIAAYPVLVIIGFFGSNGFWRLNEEHRRRGRLAFLPLLSPISATFFLFAIEMFCGGQLACHS